MEDAENDCTPRTNLRLWLRRVFNLDTAVIYINWTVPETKVGTVRIQNRHLGNVDHVSFPLTSGVEGVDGHRPRIEELVD